MYTFALSLSLHLSLFECYSAFEQVVVDNFRLILQESQQDVQDLITITGRTTAVAKNTNKFGSYKQHSGSMI